MVNGKNLPKKLELEIAEGCKRDCIPKRFIERLVTAPRVALQNACIFLYERELRAEDIRNNSCTWIFEKWANEGYADKFNEIYKEFGYDISLKEFYKKITGREPAEQGEI